MILAVLAVAASVAFAGCGDGTTLLTGSSASKPAPTAAGRAYVQALGAEQRQLGSAEQAIPRSPRTPAALARAIGLLAGAIDRLAAGLHGISPPAPVARLHSQLVGIVRTYAAQLAAAARMAPHPATAVGAADLVVSATSQTSARFAATVAQIDRLLSAG